MTPPTHKHDWHELGRSFPFNDDDFDVDRLSPDGGHVETGDPANPWKLVPASHKDLRDKVPEPTPHVILQCQDPECPDGPKHVIHVELTKPEWDKLIEAYDRGALDPDGNGSNRYLSQLSLTDLGLARIDKMLGEGRFSGARESVLEVV